MGVCVCARVWLCDASPDPPPSASDRWPHAPMPQVRLGERVARLAAFSPVIEVRPIWSVRQSQSCSWGSLGPTSGASVSCQLIETWRGDPSIVYPSVRWLVRPRVRSLARSLAGSAAGSFVGPRLLRSLTRQVNEARTKTNSHLIGLRFGSTPPKLIRAARRPSRSCSLFKRIGHVTHFSFIKRHETTTTVKKR
jgi:hypothetical protein